LKYYDDNRISNKSEQSLHYYENPNREYDSINMTCLEMARNKYLRFTNKKINVKLNTSAFVICKLVFDRLLKVKV